MIIFIDISFHIDITPLAVSLFHWLEMKIRHDMMIIDTRWWY